MASTSTRPNAIPLAVRSPYLNTWQPCDSLAGTWPRFWNGKVTAICGIARIDGAPYLFAGSPGDLVPAVMAQVGCEVTATRSVFVFEAAGVRLTATFLSPVDPDNLRRQCVPFSYVAVQTASADGADHDVSVHLDISAEWAHGDSGRPVSWQRHRTGSGGLALSFTPVGESVLCESGDQASWGTAVFATAATDGLSWELGPDTVVRERSAFEGRLLETVDAAQPRAIADAWPVAALSRDFGAVTAAAPSAAFVVAIGHVRTPALSYLGTDLAAWWTREWDGWADMVDWFLADYPAALTTAVALDRAVASAARSMLGGDAGAAHPDYAERCALAVRQAIGCTEIVDRDGTPWAFLKDIRSGGRVSPLDVLFSAAPAFLSLSPDYLRLLLEPFFDVVERDGWGEPFAPGDLGVHYPHAGGGTREGWTVGGRGPVTQTANLLIMTASLLRRLPTGAATAFASGHYAVLRQWAEYLVTNAYQAVSTGSSVADGFGAMGVIASIAGEYADQAFYSAAARALVSSTPSDADVAAGLTADGEGAADSARGLVGPVARGARLSDWYVVPATAHQGFDQPVGGGVFAPLLSLMFRP